MHVTSQTTAWNNNLSCHQYEYRSKKLLRLKGLLIHFIFMSKHLEKFAGRESRLDRYICNSCRQNHEIEIICMGKNVEKAQSSTKTEEKLC